jgi:hypothetical protein
MGITGSSSNRGVYAMTGETAKAKGGYQDFFEIWKDADPDIPILKEAKAEYESCSSPNRPCLVGRFCDNWCNQP